MRRERTAATSAAPTSPYDGTRGGRDGVGIREERGADLEQLRPDGAPGVERGEQQVGECTSASRGERFAQLADTSPGRSAPNAWRSRRLAGTESARSTREDTGLSNQR